MVIYAEADGVVNENGLAVDASKRMMTVDVMTDRSAGRHMASRIDCMMGHYDVDLSSDLLVHVHAAPVHVHYPHAHYHKDSDIRPLNRILDYS
jgi:hypothetical protein